MRSCSYLLNTHNTTSLLHEKRTIKVCNEYNKFSATDEESENEAYQVTRICLIAKMRIPQIWQNALLNMGSKNTASISHEQTLGNGKYYYSQYSFPSSSLRVSCKRDSRWSRKLLPLDELRNLQHARKWMRIFCVFQICYQIKLYRVCKWLAWSCKLSTCSCSSSLDLCSFLFNIKFFQYKSCLFFNDQLMIQYLTLLVAASSSSWAEATSRLSSSILDRNLRTWKDTFRV